MDHRATFDECGMDENTPLIVMNVCGSAADNAADTLGWNNYRDDKGNHTDEFIDQWVLSVSSILASIRDCFSVSEAEAKEAQEWFATRGIDY